MTMNRTFFLGAAAGTVATMTGPVTQPGFRPKGCARAGFRAKPGLRAT